MRDDGRTLTAEEWQAIWEGEGSSEEEEGDNYVLPKMYPGPRIRCPNCGYWQVGVRTGICRVQSTAGTGNKSTYACTYALRSTSPLGVFM